MGWDVAADTNDACERTGERQCGTCGKAIDVQLTVLPRSKPRATVVPTALPSLHLKMMDSWTTLSGDDPAPASSKPATCAERGGVSKRRRAERTVKRTMPPMSMEPPALSRQQTTRCPRSTRPVLTMPTRAGPNLRKPRVSFGRWQRATTRAVFDDPTAQQLTLVPVDH